MTTPEEQVAVEAELAKRLKSAGADEREKLYAEVYDRVYEMHLSRGGRRLTNSDSAPSLA